MKKIMKIFLLSICVIGTFSPTYAGVKFFRLMFGTLFSGGGAAALTVGYHSTWNPTSDEKSQLNKRATSTKEWVDKWAREYYKDSLQKYPQDKKDLQMCYNLVTSFSPKDYYQGYLALHKTKKSSSIGLGTGLSLAGFFLLARSVV